MGPDEVHSLITQQQKTFDAFFCLARRIDQASKKCGVGRLKKRRRGERGSRGGGERLSFIQPCVSYSLVWRDRRKEGGRDRGVERERERDGGEKRESLKHCLYAGKFWTTLLTSKCFH